SQLPIPTPSPLPARTWLAHARFRLATLRSLLRRGLSSLRSRGWRATLARALRQLRPPPAAPRRALYRPVVAPFAPLSVPCPRPGATPRASIIIPVHGQCDTTLACLHALAAHPPATACEVIVV